MQCSLALTSLTLSCVHSCCVRTCPLERVHERIEEIARGRGGAILQVTEEGRLALAMVTNDEEPHGVIYNTTAG